MSVIRRQVVIGCDGVKGCGAAYAADGFNVDLAGTRRDAKQFGWSSWRGKDFCPLHRRALVDLWSR